MAGQTKAKSNQAVDGASKSIMDMCDVSFISASTDVTLIGMCGNFKVLSNVDVGGRGTM